MTKERRQIMSFTLDPQIVTALEEKAKETGEKMSRLVEQGIRLVLALPVEPREEGAGAGSAMTRTEKDVLAVLKKMVAEKGFPWHETLDIAKRTGTTRGPTLKALHALERRGEVWLWGAATEFSDGTLGMAWGLEDPVALVLGVLKRYDETAPRWQSISGVQRIEVSSNFESALAKLCLALDNIEPVRDYWGKMLDMTPDQFDLENKREIIARLDAEERRRVQAKNQ